MDKNALLTVVITTYNHGKYLPKAIESVLQQDYLNKEIILVDDGSTDNTKDIIAGYKQIKYIFQRNAGLSAARNTGINASKGEYLVFLDADDWFLDRAFSKGIHALNADPTIAFSYGSHIKVNENNEAVLADEIQDIADDHYLHFLPYNFIAMHAAVVYRRWVFNNIRFDTSLKACEDYDIYLKITRNHRVVYHSHVMAAYRKHTENMSSNVPLMVNAGFQVKRRQIPLLKTPREKTWFVEGINFWKVYYGNMLYQQLSREPFFTFHSRRRSELFTLFRCSKKLFVKFLFPTITMNLKSIIKKKSPSFLLSFLNRIGLLEDYKPKVGKIRRGDFTTTKPFSTNFGYDRGGPVDRYYIENFLRKNAQSIKERVLEIGDNEYSLRFGGDRVAKSDVLHVENNNAKATFVGDLSKAPQLPNDTFDCIVLTQTLHLIYHHADALRTCYRILKPGGVLLLTVPGITHIDQGEWRDYWYWAYTEASVKKLLAEAFPTNSYQTETFGNVLVATAFLYGMGLPELKREEMDIRDPHYQVIITAKATKPI